MVERLVDSELNARRIQAVESCFGSSGQPLEVKGRVLVGEGILTKICRKKAKPRQFFLFNDILVYGDILIHKKKYIRQHIIPLEQVKLEDLPDEPNFKNRWLICTAMKSFAVSAATQNEKEDWMKHIKNCIDSLLRKSGKKPPEEHAAVWVPDSEAAVCMHCKKSQFTVLNRRHHCRKCGDVVCGPCSNKKFLLPTQSSKPLRVCNGCYKELDKGAGGKADQSFTSQGSANDSKDLRNRTNSSSGEEDSDDDDDVRGIQGNQPPMDAQPTFYNGSGF